MHHEGLEAARIRGLRVCCSALIFSSRARTSARPSGCSSRSSPACWPTWWWRPASRSRPPATRCCWDRRCSAGSTPPPARRSVHHRPGSRTRHRDQPATGRHRRQRRVDLQRRLLLLLRTHRRRGPVRAPEAADAGYRQGDFSLGRWFPVVAVAALVYTGGVIVIALAPQEAHTAAVYLAGAEVRRRGLVPACTCAVRSSTGSRGSPASRPQSQRSRPPPFRDRLRRHFR